MFEDEVADRAGPVWGIGADGELRNMLVRTGQEGFYMAGGTLTMCRFYSHLTALLIKATFEGLKVRFLLIEPGNNEASA